MPVIVLSKPSKDRKITCPGCESVLAFTKGDTWYDDSYGGWFIICAECGERIYNLDNATELTADELQQLQNTK